MMLACELMNGTTVNPIYDPNTETCRESCSSGYEYKAVSDPGYRLTKVTIYSRDFLFLLVITGIKFTFTRNTLTIGDTVQELTFGDLET